MASRPQFRSIDQFWPWLIRRHGAAASALSDAMDARFAGEAVDVWTPKNATLELSLDVSLAFSGDLYAQQLDWCQHQLGAPRPMPARILDLGCENGLLTCFYASFWPESTVVGVDRSDAAVERARELAERFGLENLSFRSLDYLEDDILRRCRGSL